MRTTHIVPIPESNHWDESFTVEIDGDRFTTDELRRSLQYQLGERMLFVKPKDVVSADLLYSLAVLEANARVLEPAISLLEMARDYGYHDGVDIDAKVVQYQEVVDRTWKIGQGDVIYAAATVLFWGTILVIVPLCGRWVYGRLRNRHPQASELA